MLINIKQHCVLAFFITSWGSNLAVAAHHKPSKAKYNQAANNALYKLTYDKWSSLHNTYHTSTVLALVRDNADPNSEDGGGKFLLCRYASHNNKEAVQTLLEFKADPNIGSDEQREDVPLFHAASYDMVQLLCSAKADVHYRSVHGYCHYSDNNSALHNAAYRKKRPCVLAALCQAGLDPNILNRPNNKEGKSAAALVKISCLSIAQDAALDETTDQIKRIGVLFWYGADREELERQPNYLSQTFRTRITNFLRKLSDKKQAEHRALAELVASPFKTKYEESDFNKKRAKSSFNRIMMDNKLKPIIRLITDYADEPHLTPHDIDAWDELIEVSQEHKGD